jgi:heme-degrading monooxygenase HmoA
LPVLIDVFAVAAEDDEAFLAAHEPREGGRLFRALREDADFRFVEIARADEGSYEIAHEEGDVDGAGGATLINPFEVPEGGDEPFLAAWRAARDVLAGRQGYLGTRLHRSLGQAGFRFVNVARWSSPLMFARALQDPAFQEAAAQMPFASHPALYIVVGG